MVVEHVYTEDTDLAMSLAVNQYRPPEVVRAIEESNRRFISVLGDVGRSIVEKASRFFNYFNRTGIVDKIKDRLSRTELVLSDSAFHRITRYNIYNPSLNMRRWVMAYPRAYKLYQKDRISAYDGMWEDSEPNTRPEWRTDYLKAIDGLVRFDEEGRGYTEHLVGRENELTFRQQLMIQEAWEIFDELMSKDLDPTDIENYGKGE